MWGGPEGLRPGEELLPIYWRASVSSCLPVEGNLFWLNLIDNKTSFYCLHSSFLYFFSTLKQLPFPGVRTPSLPSVLPTISSLLGDDW